MSGVASEEMDHALQIPEDCDVGPYLVLFDPLDGSSNIDINVSIGTIFSVLPAGEPHRHVKDEEFLQSGRNQLAAGYVIYGPQTQLVFTLGFGTTLFTLDLGTGNFYQTVEKLEIAPQAKEFAINCSNMRHWKLLSNAISRNCWLVQPVLVGKITTCAGSLPWSPKYIAF